VEKEFLTSQRDLTDGAGHSRKRAYRGRRELAGRIGARTCVAAVVLSLACAGGASASERPSPRNLRAISGVESLAIRWGVTSTKGLAGFRVRWRPAGAAGSASWSGSVERPAGARGYGIRGLGAMPYEVRVRALLSTSLGGVRTVVATPLAQEAEQPKEEHEQEGLEEGGPEGGGPEGGGPEGGGPEGGGPEGGGPEGGGAEEEGAEAREGPEGPQAETWEGLSAQNPLAGSLRFGSDLSPFNKPVGASGTLPNSAAMVAYLLEHEGTPADRYRPDEGSRPMFYASNSDPVLTIEAHDGSGTLHLNGRRIHVPPFAEPQKESDGHLTIVLAPADALIPGEALDFWQASITASRVKASAVGAVQMGLGGSLLMENGGGSGDAAYFGLQAGLVRAPELQAGTINHALTAVVKGVSTKVVYPARVGDGSSTDPNAPPMGQRFVLDYTFPEIEALGFKPWKVAILKALITYGFYVGDSGNERLVLLWEGSSTYPGVFPEPFAAIGAEQGVPSSGGGYDFNLAQGIDWSRLRAVAPPSA
jgi:hypothetical protein